MNNVIGIIRAMEEEIEGLRDTITKIASDAEFARTGCDDRAEFMVALADIVDMADETLEKRYGKRIE